MSDDQHYLSWLASAALAVLMVIVMFWIRSQIPDSATVVEPLQTATDHAAAISNAALAQTRAAAASAYECVGGSTPSLSESPCSTGGVLRHIGAQADHKSVVMHHR